MNLGDNVIDFDEFGNTDIIGQIEIGASVGESVILESSPLGLIATVSRSAAFGDNTRWHLTTMDPGAFTASSSGTDPAVRFLMYSFIDQPVARVGGFINYCTGFCAGNDVTISVLDENMVSLESYDLMLDAPIAGIGAYRGIARTNADIAAFVISSSGTFFALDDLTFGRVAVIPIPAAIWLFVSALGLLGWIRRKET
jgi:hypothetical protein